MSAAIRRPLPWPGLALAAAGAGALAWAALSSRPPAPVAPPVFVPPAPLQLILAPTGDQKIDRVQDSLRPGGGRPAARVAALEQLGWLFVAKARADYDEGANILAEQCGLQIDAEAPGNPAGLLLRGHVLHQFHRFAEVETIARRLVAARGAESDYGLLGDACMEQGRLEEAGAAYQKMLDLRPGFESFVRAAHFRWLKGELAGAIALMQQARGMADDADPATVAWAETRLALYQLQAGDLPGAESHAQAALAAKRGDAAAMLALGRILSAEGREDEAIQNFIAAARANPLPDYLWQVSDHLRGAGRAADAAPFEATLRRTGRRADPRTYSLYLSTTKQDPALALELAIAEMKTRQDVFTWDALAWAQLAAGKPEAARESMKHALAEGTQDGRLFLHAAVINGTDRERAEELKRMLLPSEQLWLAGPLP